MAIREHARLNYARLVEQIRAHKMDAVVAMSTPNLTYTSGFYNFDLTLLPFERLHATVTDANGLMTFIHPVREEPVDTFVDDVVVYNGQEESGVKVLADVLQRRGMQDANIGIEMNVLPAATFAQLQDAVPGARWSEADSLFDEVRLIKTSTEIELLRDAAVATERAIIAGYAMARPGDTEKATVDMMGYSVTRNGADFVAFNVFASGPRTTHGHHLAERVTLDPGNIVRVDYGASFSGYYSDLVRMAVVGQPSPRQQDIYRRVVDLQQEMIGLCRPGSSIRELWNTTVRSYERHLMPLTRNMFGHSIGRSVHEPPIINAFDDRIIEPGMVLCIEHGWTDHKHSERYHIENMIAVTESNPEVLDNTSSIDEMWVIA